MRGGEQVFIGVGFIRLFRRQGGQRAGRSLFQRPGVHLFALLLGKIRHRAAHPALEIDADAVMAGRTTAADVAGWLLAQRDDLPLAYSSADPERVRAAQARHGRDASAAAIEALFAETARRLVAGGVRRLVTAGGETSGAVVEGLGLAALEIGPEIDPGVPAVRAGELALALKSGNFGRPSFFAEAARVLGTGA